MGRPRVFRREPLTTVSVYLSDAIFIEKFQKDKDTRADSLRKILVAFDPSGVKEAQRETQKKLDRQALLRGRTDDQSTLDSMYCQGRTIKDMEFTRKDLIDMRMEAKPSKDPLAKRYADESVTKALHRGDCIQTESGNYVIVRKWF